MIERSGLVCFSIYFIFFSYLSLHFKGDKCSLISLFVLSVLMMIYCWLLYDCRFVVAHAHRYQAESKRYEYILPATIIAATTATYNTYVCVCVRVNEWMYDITNVNERYINFIWGCGHEPRTATKQRAYTLHNTYRVHGIYIRLIQ